MVTLVYAHKRHGQALLTYLFCAHIMPTVGRPKLPDGAGKTSTLNIRITEAEKAEVTAAARRAGASGASDWVRILALREARKI